MSTSKKIRLLLLVFVLTSFYMGSIFFDKHKLRSSLIKTVEINSEEISQADSIVHFFEDVTYLKKFKAFIPTVLINNSDQTTTINILQFLGKHYCVNQTSYQSLTPEYPELILNDLQINKTRGSCYNDAILFNTILQAVNIKSRLVSFNENDGLGGSGHTLSEVYFSE